MAAPKSERYALLRKRDAKEYVYETKQRTKQTRNRFQAEKFHRNKIYLTKLQKQPVS